MGKHSLVCGIDLAGFGIGVKYLKRGDKVIVEIQNDQIKVIERNGEPIKFLRLSHADFQKLFVDPYRLRPSKI